MKLVALFVVSLAVIACVPPYLADLDKAAPLTRQMTVLGTAGPSSSFGGGSTGGIRYLPVKPTATSIGSVNVQSGFVVTQDLYNYYLQFAYTDSSDQLQTTPTTPFSLVGADPNYPLWEFDVTTTTGTANMIVLFLSPTAPSSSNGNLYTATLPSGPLASASTMTLSSVFSTFNTLGVSVSPNQLTADAFNFLLASGSVYGAGSTTVNTALSPLFNSGTTTTDPVLGSIAAAVASSDSAPRLLAGTGSDKVHLLVVCTAERGLCGPFNSSIVRLAREKANVLTAEGKEVKILCVGRKGADQLRRLYGKLIIETIELRGVRTIGFEQADMIAKKIVALFEQGAFDVATLFFSRFRSVIAQIPTAQQIIPPVFENAAETGPAASYEYEPEEGEILAELLPRNLSVQVFRALLENAASEQGARMSAMDNATRNAGEMIRKQTLTYNRTRQAMITKELIEIISGAEAL